MKEKLLRVQFANSSNPRSAFDIVSLERVLNVPHAIDPTQLHKVDFFLILYIEEGEGQHTIDFKNHKLKPGTILTIRKDQIQKFHHNKQLRGQMLLFTNEFLITYLEKIEFQKSLQLFNELLGAPKIQLGKKDKAEISEIIGRLQKEYFQINDNFSLNIIRSELQILITKLYRIKSRSSKMISDKKYLAEFIEFQQLVEEKAAQTTRVQYYAKEMGISTKTLNTISKNIVNKTAKAFIDEICIKQIKRQLINTPLSIKEIAYATGFDETTNFYKYFKRHVGKTPEQFRLT